MTFLAFEPLWFNATLAQVAGLFTTPALAAAGAAAVSVPVIIHLLFRMRRKRLDWGAMRFLLEALRKQRRRLRLEQWLLLLVRCLVVVILGLALAGPLLAGCASVLYGASGQGRVIHVVVDDALSSGMAEAGGQTRLARLVEQASAVVEAAGEADRVVLWRAGRPIERIESGVDAAEGVSPRAGVLAALGAMEPRYGASALDEVLGRVAEELRDGEVDPSRAVVVVLSDFARGSGFWDEPPGPELEALGRRANLVVSGASGPASNLQVASVESRRSMVVVDPGGGTSVAVQATVRRFGPAASAETVRLRVELVDASGQVVAGLDRPVPFASGQSVAPVSVDLPAPTTRVEEAEGDEDTADRAGRSLAVRASLVPMSDVAIDGLSADDRGYAVVRLRSSLRVGLVEDVSAPVVSSAGLRPGQWLEIALSLGLGVEGFEVRVVPPSSAGGGVLEELDAVMVMRPDLLSAPAWDALSGFAQRGGLVWVFTPNDTRGWDWTRLMQQRLGLVWEAGPEPVDVETAVGLDVDSTAPEALSLIAATWRDLLTPVRVGRWLPIDSGGSEVWLRLEDGSPLLVMQRRGSGAVLLLGTALDPDWSSLATKPLLVPLVQDAVRGVLAESDGSGGVLVSGQAWEGTGGEDVEMVRRVGVGLDAEAPEGFRRGEPAVWPGVYTADGAGQMLTVNPASDAGDTGVVEPARLRAWLDALGPWSELDAAAPEQSLTARTAPTNLGWTLLWVLLGLVLLETLLARKFSHASVHEGESIAKRVLGHLRGEGSSAGRGRRGQAA